MSDSHTETSPDKRSEIVQQAYAVFFEQGCHATAVDRLLENSGISKRTLYKYFRSKEELVAAAVEYYRDKTFATVCAALDQRCTDPREKIVAVFDLRREILEAGDFSGCFAINAGLEYDGKDAAIQAACTSFVDRFEKLFLELCQAAGLRDPAITTRQLMVLLEGTIVYGQAKRDPAVASAARAMATLLLASA